MNLQTKMPSWLILLSPSRPVLSRHVQRWWVDWTRHLSVGCSLRPSILKRAGLEIATPLTGHQPVVLTSKFAQTMPDRSHDEFCKAWQCPVLSSNQMQLAISGSAESIWMATVESSRASCSKMSIRFQGARQMLLPWCSFLANVLIRASQTAWYYLSMLQGS